MRKSILFASFAVVSLSLYGMQDGFNSEMNAEKTNSRLSLALSDVSDFQDTVFNKKESSSSSIQWNIFESEDKGDQKVQGDFSDSSDMESIPSVSEIFEKILNPKVKTEQSEVSDSTIQTQIELLESSGETVQLPKKINELPKMIGAKRKVSMTSETKKDSCKKKRIKTSSEENNPKNITIDKENAPKNIKSNKKRHFAKKTGSKADDFIVRTKNNEIKELKREIERQRSQIEELRIIKIRLQTRQNQLKVCNDKAEDRIEELDNLVLEKEVELELERSNNQNSIAQRAGFEEKSKELSKQIDFLRQQISTLQTSEEESKKQKEELNIKIIEQNKKITDLNRLLQNKETEIQRIQQTTKNRTEKSVSFEQSNLQRFGQWLREKGAEILQEKEKKIAELTEQLNIEKGKESRFMFSWNQTLNRLKEIQQREQEIQNREGFWNNLLGNKDKQISDLSAQLQRFQAERNNVIAQHQQTQASLANLTTQLQKSQTETISLANQLKETQKEMQHALQTKNQELAELQAKLEIKPVKQEVVDIHKSQQNDNKFEHLYQQTKRRLKETEKSLKDSKNEIREIQGRYEVELNKKEGYKSEVNRLNQALADEQKKSEQQKKESEQVNGTLNRILLGERWWQNVLKPLNASQKKNEDLREYLLRLMKHSSTRSLINRFSKGEHSEEIVQQFTHNVDIKEHFRILDNNQYYWLTSKIREECELFSRSNVCNENLLKKLKDRNDRAKRQLDKVDRDNEFLMQIIRELKRDKDIECYIRESLELQYPTLSVKIDRYLTQNISIEKQ